MGYMDSMIVNSSIEAGPLTFRAVPTGVERQESERPHEFDEPRRLSCIEVHFKVLASAHKISMCWPCYIISTPPLPGFARPSIHLPTSFQLSCQLSYTPANIPTNLGTRTAILALGVTGKTTAEVAGLLELPDRTVNDIYPRAIERREGSIQLNALFKLMIYLLLMHYAPASLKSNC